MKIHPLPSSLCSMAHHLHFHFPPPLPTANTASSRLGELGSPRAAPYCLSWTPREARINWHQQQQWASSSRSPGCSLAAQEQAWRKGTCSLLPLFLLSPAKPGSTSSPTKVRQEWLWRAPWVGEEVKEGEGRECASEQEEEEWGREDF